MEIELYMKNTMIQLTPMVALDIKEMMGLHNDSEEAYFKVDEIAAHYGKEVFNFFDPYKNVPRVEYIKARIDERSGEKVDVEDTTSAPEDHEKLDSDFGVELLSRNEYKNELFKATRFSKTKSSNHYVNRVRYNRYDLDYIAYRLDGRSKDMKAEIKGTYIHSDLAMEFMRWLSPKLAVKLDIAFKSVVKQLMTLKEERRATIREFHRLTPVIDKYYTPKQTQGFPQQYARERLFDMINIEVLGCKASTFKDKNNIKYTEATRDWATSEQLEQLAKAEEIVYGLIKYRRVTDYQTLKAELHYMMVNED